MSNSRCPYSLLALAERHPLAVGLVGLAIGAICALLALQALAPEVAPYF